MVLFVFSFVMVFTHSLDYYSDYVRVKPVEIKFMWPIGIITMFELCQLRCNKLRKSRKRRSWMF